jgi:NAD(P)-dependent dehydrogenase (short-subunit alcohol dehydrogenase family)
MDLHLSGKAAVVTGGSKGIGLAVVRTLLAEGMRVVSASRTLTPGLEETDAAAVHVDLSTREGPIELIERAGPNSAPSMCWSTTSALGTPPT